jgi:hypothetical protein
LLRCLFSLVSIEMSGTPPPNYNPNDSLLSGGDSAKIIPVQGGGFMPSGNYNADVSLLSGGEDAKIIPVQGGGNPPTLTEQKAASKNISEAGERLQSMRSFIRELESLEKQPPGVERDKSLAIFKDSIGKAPDFAKRASDALEKGTKALLPKSDLEYAKLVNEIARLQAQAKTEERDTKLKELYAKFEKLPPLTVFEEENEENNNNSSTLPSLNDLDVSVFADEGNLSNLNEENNIGNLENTEGNTEGSEDTKEEKEAKPLEIPCPVPEKDEIEDLPETFTASDDTVDSKVKETIRIVSREFYIRVAKRKLTGQKKDDDIMSDWKAGKFTEDEAEFLNTLGLSPKLLYSSFYCLSKDWKEEVADFLYFLGVFTCYPASALMLKGECQRVREFLMIVESNLKAEQLRTLAEKPVPVAGPISLPGLEDIEENEEKSTTEDTERGHVQIFNRLKDLNVDATTTDNPKSIAKKITNFFKKMKPSFLKTKQERLYNSVLDEIFKLEKEGKLNSNQKNLELSNENLTFNLNINTDEEIDEEEIKRQFEEKMKQLKIKKFMESLPEKYRNVDLSIFIQRMVEKK